MARQLLLRFRRLDVKDEGVAIPMCECAFPRVIHNNGCGHAPACPVYREWWVLQQAVLRFRGSRRG
jgi:hypothetical protein